MGPGRWLHPPDDAAPVWRPALEGGVGGLGDSRPLRNRRPVRLGYRLDEIVQALDGDGEADIHPAADGDHGVGIEAAVELSPGPGVAHPPHRLSQEGPHSRDITRRRSGGDGHLGWPARRSRRSSSRSMVNGASPGPAPAFQAREQLSAHPVQLTCPHTGRCPGWRADHTAQGACGPPGATRQRRPVATSQRGGHQRHHLVAGVGSAWGPAQVQVPVNQLGQAQMQGRGKDHIVRRWSSKAMWMPSA